MPNDSPIKEECREFVRCACQHLQDYFNLQNWDVSLEWCKKDEQPAEYVALSIDVDSRYHNATISVYPNLEDVWESDRKSALECVVHEFAHILTDPLYDWALKAVPKMTEDMVRTINEQQVQDIARIVFKGLSEEFLTQLEINTDAEIDKDMDTDGHAPESQADGDGRLEASRLSGKDYRKLPASYPSRRQGNSSWRCDHRPKRNA